MPELFAVQTIPQALGALLPCVTPLQRTERVPLFEALRRVLAEDLYATVDLPAFARSTMDGFAVRAADTYGASEGLPAYLTIRGEVPMGCAAEVPIGVGEAARIHTGGMLPPNADAVVMVEHTQPVSEHMIEAVRAVAVGENVIPVGDDVRAGTVLFPRNHVLRPQDLGGLAGVGIVDVSVVARPRVAILASGDEVVPAHTTPALGQVRDINSTTIAALAQQTGGEPILCGIAPDDRATLHAMACVALAKADILIISAGSSVSTRDMTATVISELGAPGVLVHGVAMRPGKPTILAMCDGKPVFGLPGNPVSTIIAFNLFVVPTLQKMLHHFTAEDAEGGEYFKSSAPLPSSAVKKHARLAQNIASHSGSEDFVSVKLLQRNGECWAEPIFGKSNLIYTIARADGLVRVPLDKAGLYAGDLVEVELI